MGVKITIDEVQRVVTAVARLTKNEVLIGIPGENASRDQSKGAPRAPISNVGLGFIHEFGFDEKNIPPRPFLVPGVQEALPDLLPRLRKAGQQAFDFKDVSTITQQLIGVGIAAASAVQMKVTTGPFAPLADATKRARLYRKAGYQRASDMRKSRMMDKWMSGTFAPLIDTGAMRQAVTFVIRQKGK